MKQGKILHCLEVLKPAYFEHENKYNFYAMNKFDQKMNKSAPTVHSLKCDDSAPARYLQKACEGQQFEPKAVSRPPVSTIFKEMFSCMNWYPWA